VVPIRDALALRVAPLAAGRAALAQGDPCLNTACNTTY
jgi:hypothetical protein